ncbi:AAA family ATPase [Vallitalea guaymasensis]|uniref:AAA family ATPase n=1 Tax=Vallitalea guaymasensis TaxID=1185412 RepID=UPI002353F2C9|nr:AAA family ATPase [Vallitalea guaymasensis]
MIRLNIIIADYDKGYLNAISRFLSSWHETEYNVISFTEKELLTKYLETAKADILLISPKLMAEDLDLSNVQVTIINTPDRVPESLLTYPYINKYQPGDVVAKELISIFSINSKDEIIVKKNTVGTKVIGVYSPIGGSGKTTVSVGLAKQYAINSFKTLFLSLEEMASYKTILECNNTNNLSDLLYYIKQKNKNLMMKIEGLKNTDNDSGMDYFSPPYCYKDIHEVSINEWIELIDYIRDNSNYERIVLDFDSNLSEKNLKLLQACEEVLLLTNIDKMALTKLNHMYNSLKKMDIEDVNANVRIIINNTKKDNEVLEGVSMMDKEVQIYLPYDNNLLIDIGEISNINLDSCFGRVLSDYVTKDIKSEGK